MELDFEEQEDNYTYQGDLYKKKEGNFEAHH